MYEEGFLLHEGQEKYLYCNSPPLHLRKKLAGSQGNPRRNRVAIFDAYKPEATKRLSSSMAE
jgi:hypothetical protein